MGLQHGGAGRVWKAAFRAAQDLIFPHHALDDAEPAQGAGLSGAGWSRVTFLEDPVCDGCGAPFEHAPPPDLGGAPGRCAACEARPRAFSRARAACVYDAASRDLILRFKHADRPDLAALFSAWIERAAAPLLAEAEVLAPVPLHRGRLLMRRYNQSAEIARRLARRTGLVYAPDVLRRVKATAGQGGKSASGRRRNVAGAFAADAAGRARVAGRKVVLVDDVLTTGATAEACSRALLAAGAQSVSLAVVARVREAFAPSI